MKKLAKYTSLIIGLILLAAQPGFPQDANRSLTLEEAIQLALDRSPNALMAKHQLKGEYWKYKSYKASTLPYMSLWGNAPSYRNSIGKYQSPKNADGVSHIEYSRSNLIVAEGGLSVNQNIGYTGTSISINSNFDRTTNLLADEDPTEYYFMPLNMNITQPIFKFNQFKWDRKIEPIRYDEAILNYMQQREDVISKAIDVFFNLLTAQIDYQINQVNLANNDTIYRIAQGRFEIGTIPENELLQLELELLKSKASIEHNKLAYNNKLFELRSFLKFNDAELIELVPPTNVMTLEIDAEKAKIQAWENNPETRAFERRELEALMSVDKAKKENSFGFDLKMGYGLSNNANKFKEVYAEFQPAQTVSLGINVPILDWGRGKGQIQMAESRLELEKLRLEQEKIDFDQKVYLQVKEFNMQQYQLEIAQKSDVVAQKGYRIAKQRFMIGKIDNLNFNRAQTNKDQAKIGYLDALRNYWKKYYEVRKLTLYDFIKNQQIEFRIEEVIE
ncbi:MAG: TolC family protein [Bacteroidales bacterium]|nr:TolC family protein [Bacteroidales bacterium]